MARGKVDIDDIPDPDERLHLAVNLREGLDPEGVFSDWGDLESDERKRPESRDDIHCSTPDEVERYHNENRPSGWWPL